MPTRTRSKSLKMFGVLLISLAVLILDRITKSIVVSKLSLSESIPVVKDIFHITLVHNKGAAFGILQNATLFFIIISAACILFIIYYLVYKKEEYYQSFLMKCSLAFILAGAIGNLIDRIKYSYVIDFLDFRIWPVFNVADSAITLGTCFLLWKMLRQGKEKAS